MDAVMRDVQPSILENLNELVHRMVQAVHSANKQIPESKSLWGKRERAAKRAAIAATYGEVGRMLGDLAHRYATILEHKSVGGDLNYMHRNALIGTLRGPNMVVPPDVAEKIAEGLLENMWNLQHIYLACASAFGRLK